MRKNRDIDDMEFEARLKGLLSQNFSEGTETFRDALLERCLDVLDADGGKAELEDEALELLAAAGDIWMIKADPNRTKSGA